ncbi:hypothetical protein BDZ91DRAFT_719849 [Kalaharituber pfeilii]|nr:hypothetical protein BDZ91DRAFT_719849 [Kalaharituber pfeilii]
MDPAFSCESQNPACDPMVLAHLCAASIGFQINPALEEPRRTECLNLPSREHRLAQIAEAIAICAVKKPADEVLAVHLRLNHQAIQLTLAGNDAIAKEVQDHLRNMWDYLANISMNSRKIPALKDYELGEDNVSPESMEDLPERLGDAIRDFQQAVYKFCPPKFRKTFQKWYRKLENFGNKIRGEITFQYANRPNQSEIFQLLEFFAGVDEVLSSGRKINVALISEYMDAATTLAEAIMASHGCCEFWDNYVPENDSIHIRRALEKSTSLHRHMDILIRCACSPRLHAWFTKPLHLTVLKPPRVLPVEWPSKESLSTWLEIAQSLIPTNETLDSLQSVAANATTLPHNTKVHCEVQLALHLHTTHQNSNSTSFTYIGVSKLSCRPCFIFLDALNHLGGATYLTRRTHSKWYPGWGMPDCNGSSLTFKEETQLKERIVARMKEEFVEFITKVEHERLRRSDSSDASFNAENIRARHWKVRRGEELLRTHQKRFQRPIGPAKPTIVSPENIFHVIVVMVMATSFIGIFLRTPKLGG